MRFLALALTLVAASANAQYTNTLTGLNYSNPYAANAAFFQQQMQQNAYFQTRLRAVTTPTPAPQAAAPVKAAPPTFKHALTATDFTPAGKRTMPEQFAKNAQTPGERAQVIQLCRAIQSGIEAQPGVRKHNLSTAVTVLLGVSLQVSTGREFSDAESEGLQLVINDALAELPGFKAMSNEKRTAAYDAFLITGGLIAGMAQNATQTGDAAQLALARDMAKQALTQFLK